MVKMNIKELKNELTRDEVLELEDAAARAIVFDEESPEMTPEMLEKMFIRVFKKVFVDLFLR